MKTAGRRKSPEEYQKRTYRGVAEASGLLSSYVRIRETDLHILAEADVSRKAGELAAHYRLQVEHYLAGRPQFGTALVPIDDDALAPPIIREMLGAARLAGVGPMAAVAGAIAQYVGYGLIRAGSREVIVENGGDIFLQRSRRCTVAIFAGESPLSQRVGLVFEPARLPAGVCTSSGTIGHSLSFGTADSVTVVADSAVVADAAATRLGNEVGLAKKRRAGISRALETARQLSTIRGAVVICGELMGACGEVELISLD